MKGAKEFIDEYNDGKANINDTILNIRKRRELIESELKEIKDFEYENLENIQEGIYKGFEFKVVNGRKTWNYKNIDEWIETEKEKKRIEKQAQTAFDMFVTTGQKPITEDGEILPLPEINYGKSYLKLTKSK